MLVGKHRSILRKNRKRNTKKPREGRERKTRRKQEEVREEKEIKQENLFGTGTETLRKKYGSNSRKRMPKSRKKFWKIFVYAEGSLIDASRCRQKSKTCYINEASEEDIKGAEVDVEL